MEYIESHVTDPHWNLALEQYVFDSMDRSKSYLMLWQNDNTIVVGKYQNAIAEINNDYVQEHNIQVVRRLSVGGTVYHDLGNLNFTFITDADQAQSINFKLFCQPIVETLASFGVKAEISGRNDMTVDGKKFSGNAQYVREGRVMHHGTIMLHSDLSVLSRALHVDEAKIASKGIKSVVSRVTNLCDYLPEGVGIEEFRARLLEHMSEKEPMHRRELTEEEIRTIDGIKCERYDTWQWNYGRSPSYTICRRQRIDGCGSLEVSLSVEKGVIGDAELFGDFFALGDIDTLLEKLRGCEYRKQAIAERLSEINVGAFIRNLSAERLAELLAPQ